LGQLVTTGLMQEKVELSTINWSSGLYYIKNDLNSEVFKVQK